MSSSVYVLVGLAYVLLASCAGTTAPPALVLQLSQITRARATERAHDRWRELTFTAALSVGLETTRAVVDPRALDPPTTPAGAVACEPVESPICVWARAAEESAWLVAREHVEVMP